MDSTDGSNDRVDQIYTPSTGGGVYTAGHAHREKSSRRRSTVKEKVIDIEAASVDEKDDGVEERDFHKKQVQQFIPPPPLPLSFFFFDIDSRSSHRLSRDGN